MTPTPATETAASRALPRDQKTRMDEVRQNQEEFVIDELKPTQQTFNTVVQDLTCLALADGVTENVKRLTDTTID